jgi:hypothetical protein
MAKAITWVETAVSKGDVERETDKAICVRVIHGVTRFGSNRLVWLPKSQVKWAPPNGGSDTHFHDCLYVAQWLAIENNI